MSRSALLKECNLNFFFYLRVHAFARNCPGHRIFLTNLWEFLKCPGDIFLVVRFDRVKMFHPFDLKKLLCIFILYFDGKNICQISYPILGIFKKEMSLQP